ncbi:sodium/hydrogen exchanger 6 [Tanacetum coccineum]
MESGTNLNKGEGLVGKSKADDLRAFTHKSTTEIRRAIGELKNPNSSFKGPRVVDGSFPEGEHARDSSLVGRLNNEDPGVNLGSTLVSQVENTNDHDSPIVQFVDINMIPKSYAGAATKDQINVNFNFCSLVADKVFDGVNISIPRKVIKKVSLRFENTLYGYFIGKRMAFPVVEYYVKTNWAKYGLKRIMMNAKGLFFFKFDAVLEGGPWMVLFEEDRISLIAMYLGKPIMLDSYTSSMCKDSWGRGSFARCLIEINSDADFIESIILGIPDLDGPCETCPKKVVATSVMNDTNVTNDGFQKVVNRKHTNKGSSAGNKLPKGVLVGKGFQVGKEFAFQPKATSSNGNTGTRSETNPKAGPSKNMKDDSLLITKDTNTRQQDTMDDDEEEEVENIWDESKNLNLRKTRASTPAQTVSDVYNLVGHAGLMRNRPWVLLSDFNASLNLEDHSAGGYEPNTAMPEFKECVQAMEVTDVISTGLHFTWNQKPKGANGILKKIDRIMGNLQFIDDFPGSFAIFHPYRILNHSPCVLSQKAIDRDPPSSILREEHAHYLLAFKEAQLDEERFLKQKAKIECLKAGDSNTTYFHKTVKGKCARNKIEMFLRAEGLDDHDLFTHVLDDAKANFMVRDVSNDEVKSVIFYMGDDRAPGPNGFTAAFFKKAWDVVGGDITCDVWDFFTNGKLLKELNHTIISHIPKVTTLARINDYRPISCCNVLYKCISKIIANRVKEGLGDIVSINQSAFVPGRRISNNILLTQELMRNYHRRRGPPRCAFKVDIQKAYDNGDPLSPYLFTLVMEILTLTLQHRVRDSDELQYHHLCEQQRIINLCFADDVSGLVPSIPKSMVFFCNVLNAIKASILNSMPFAEGVLHVRYLGVPLISSRLLYRDCKILVEKLESKVNDWRNKFLSLASQQLMRGFLWCQGEMKKGKAKVAWDSVCMPKHEGGLIDDFNVALMAAHIWSILTHRESLWVKWVHTYKLKGHSFWDVPCRGDVSWGWRKLLQIRSIIRPFIWHKINNGKSTSAWFDRWADVCPLKDMFSNRDIARSGFSLDDLVNNLISDGVWDGVLRPFSVSCVWDTIRTRADIVNWYNVVWSKVCVLWGMDSIPPRLIDVTTFITPISKGKTAISILSRLVLAATSYYIWLERNGRLFKKKTSSPDQIVDVIIYMVRLKLVTFKFKKMSTLSQLLLDQWKIPSYCIVHDGSSR